MDDIIPDRPSTVRLDETALSPRRPLAFARQALEGSFSSQGIHLLVAWAAFVLAPAAAWALHLRTLAGPTGLTAYWGELLTARDLWELFHHGGLQARPGGVAPLLAGLALLWVLWAGWTVQARAAGLRPRLAPWLLGALDALIIGLLPIGLLFGLFIAILRGLASTGIQGLGWMNLLLSNLLLASGLSALFLQWWLCRLSRYPAPFGGQRAWVAHLRNCFLSFWTQFFQWGLLALLGTVLRLGLHAAVLYLAWRIGGGSPGKVWAFLGMQLLATLLNAWFLGWMLRLSAHFWLNEERVRAAIQDIERAASAPEVPHEA